MYGARLLTLRIIRVTKETFWINNMASRAYTGNTATSETVAQALGELSLTQADQEGLCEFLTDYFTSENHEFSSGK